MYFTPDGRYAIVVAERLHRLDFRDAHTFKLHHSLHVPCSGVDHMDFSADGTLRDRQLRVLGPDAEGRHRAASGSTACSRCAPGAAPQDVKLSPDGKVFYVADMNANGVWLVDGDALRVLRFMPTGARRARPVPEPRRALPLRHEPRRGLDLGRLVRDAAHRRARGASPAAAAPTWATSRPTARCSGCPAATTASSTRSARRTAGCSRGSPSAPGRTALCVWPQPGRYSLGHTGILR